MAVSTEGTKYAWLKPGVKVKVVKARLSTFWYANMIGKEFLVKRVVRHHSQGGFDFEAEENAFGLLEAADVELVVKPVLDASTRNVYFLFDNRQQAKAILTLLEELGFMWLSGHKPTEWDRYHDKGSLAISPNGDLTQSRDSYVPYQNCQRIDLTFETRVVGAELDETPQQRELREIEEELKKLQDKANTLRQQI